MTGWKTAPRSYYNYGSFTTSYAIKDAGFYNGWTGGRYDATPAFSGTVLVNRSTGDKYCQKYFGPKSRMAEHHDGWYMSYMNTPPPKVGASWNWVRRGGWNGWGKFGTGLGCERMWTWIQNQNANCGVTDYKT